MARRAVRSTYVAEGQMSLFDLFAIGEEKG